MKIIVNKPLVDLRNEPILDQDNQPITIGKQIADILIQPTEHPTMKPLKAYLLAQKFYQNDEVEIDEADLTEIQRTVETVPNRSPIVVGQIIQLLRDVQTAINDNKDTSSN